jgi:PhnB protein
MITINPYLNFNGNCQEAFEFYKSVFGGDFPYVGRFKDMPDDSGHPLPDELKELVMHISLPISKETALMGSDVAEAFGQKADFGNNINLMINAQSKEETDAIWAKLSVGATITMPLENAFWGDYFGALVDKFGVNWMINCPSGA